MATTDESTRMNNPTGSNTTGNIDIDKILIGLSAMSDGLSVATKSAKDLILTFNKIKKDGTDTTATVRKTTNDLERFRRSIDYNIKSIEQATDYNNLYSKMMRDFEASSRDTIRSLDRMNIDTTSISENFETFSNNLKKQERVIKDYSKSMDSTKKELLALKKAIREEKDESKKQALESKYSALGEKYEQISNVVEKLIRQSDEAINNQGKSTESLRRILERTSDTQSAYRTARESVPIAGYFSSILGKREDIKKERAETLGAFDERIRELETFIKGSDEDIKSNKKNIKDQNATIKDANESIKQLDTEIDKIDELLSQQLTDEERAKLEEQKALKEKQRLEEKQRKETAQILKQASKNNINDATNAKKEAENQKKEAENQKDFIKKSQSAFADIGKELYNVAKNFITNVATTFYDKQKDALNQVYSSIEQNQNQIARKLKLDSGEYDTFFDEIQAKLIESGMQGSVSFDEVGEEIASMVESGIRDTDLLTALAQSATYLKATGSTINISDEELLKNLKALYDVTLRQTGSQESADKAVNDFIQQISATETKIIEDLGSVTALQGGQLTQMMNTILETGKATGFANVQGLTESQMSLMYTAQAVENIGGDASVLQDFIKSIQDYTEYSQLSSEQLVLAEQYGLSRESLNEAISSGNLSTFLNAWFQEQASLYGGQDINTLGYVTTAYGNQQSPQRVAYMTQAIQEGRLSATQLNIEDIQTTYRNELNSISEGEYLTATQKAEVENRNRWYDEAQKINDYAYGGEILNKTVSSIEGMVGNILQIMLTQGTIQPAINAIGSGLGATGNALKSTFTADNAKSFALGGKLGSSTGTASNLGNIVGYGTSAILVTSSIASNLNDAESFNDVVEGTLTDPMFYGGIGTALGTAIAGPVGGAVVGGISSLAGTLGNYIGDSIANSANNSLSNISQPIIDAANSLNDSAETQMESVMELRQAQMDLSDEQKKAFLISQGYATIQDIGNLSGSELSDYYEKLISSKESKAQRQAERSETISAMSTNLTSLEDLIQQSKVDYSAEVLMDAPALSIAENLMEFAGTGYTGEEAITNLFGEDLAISEEAKNAIISRYNTLTTNYETYEKNNIQFKNKWKDAVSAVNDGKYPDPLVAYYNMYGVDIAKSLMFAEDGYNYISDEQGIPDLYHNRQYTLIGEYATGLDYVPYDNFPALLHRGETVMNKSVADDYWENVSSMFNTLENVSHETSAVINNIDTSSVSDTITDKSDEIIALLKKLIDLVSTNQLRPTSLLSPFRGIDSNISRINA